MTALVGPSGGGKSTIASLLARFWDVKSGQILIRGKDLRQVKLSDLMDHISMVFQRVYLFQDTIYNNISMGRPDASREEVIEAAKKARCYDFIMALPEGFDTIVGEGGETLSGGEKQRISIARCILKDAPLVILDEATASVDADNESYIQEAISELCRGKTLLVIAHRLGTIRNADPDPGGGGRPDRPVRHSRGPDAGRRHLQELRHGQRAESGLEPQEVIGLRDLNRSRSRRHQAA